MTRGASCWVVPARIEMGLRLCGIDALQTIDDMQDIVAAAFFAVGHDVDARAVLVLDRLERGPVQQSRKLGWPEFLSATVEGKAEAVEQRSAILPVDIARLRIAADDRRQDLALRPGCSWCWSGRNARLEPLAARLVEQQRVLRRESERDVVALAMACVGAGLEKAHETQRRLRRIEHFAPHRLDGDDSRRRPVAFDLQALRPDAEHDVRPAAEPASGIVASMHLDAVRPRHGRRTG